LLNQLADREFLAPLLFIHLKLLQRFLNTAATLRLRPLWTIRMFSGPASTT